MKGKKKGFLFFFNLNLQNGCFPPFFFFGLGIKIALLAPEKKPQRKKFPYLPKFLAPRLKINTSPPPLTLLLGPPTTIKNRIPEKPKKFFPIYKPNQIAPQKEKIQGLAKF